MKPRYQGPFVWSIAVFGAHHTSLTEDSAALPRGKVPGLHLLLAIFLLMLKEQAFNEPFSIFYSL